MFFIGKYNFLVEVSKISLTKFYPQADRKVN